MFIYLGLWWLHAENKKDDQVKLNKKYDKNKQESGFVRPMYIQT
jgi:hypothetical protein